MCKRGGCNHIPCRLVVQGRDVVAVLVGGDTLEEFSHEFGQHKGRWVARLQAIQKRRKDALGGGGCRSFVRYLEQACLFGNADEAIPRLVELFRLVVERWVEAAEVE